LRHGPAWHAGQSAPNRIAAGRLETESEIAYLTKVLVLNQAVIEGRLEPGCWLALEFCQRQLEFGAIKV